MSELHTERIIAMPNEIFEEMKEWVNNGELKSVQHQEFVYSYYWLITYLWKYAKYAEQEYTQSRIKQMLGYYPNEKRLNYIIKENGLLDGKEYSKAMMDYPVTWSLKEGDLSFSMLSEYDKVDRQYLIHFKTHKFFVKAPLKSIGTESEEGIFWHSSNAHMINGDVFKACMENEGLGCAAFYLYGLFVYMRDKNLHFNNSETFSCANKTLVELTGWNEKRVTKITGNMVKAKLIEKKQNVKVRGSVNTYKLYQP